MSSSSGWAAMRSFSRDGSVREHRLAPGTLRRVAALARPHRRPLAVFTALVVVDGALVAVPPLLLRHLIDDGVRTGDRSVVVVLALFVAVVALAEAALSLVQRWLSARIGEGLIYDLRSAVFEHVQRQSIGFFTRSQTGALVSRLNSDVVGAQQAFTSTAAGVLSNAVTLAAVLTAMLFLSWQVTLLALVVVPAFLLPARRVGRRLAALRREAMQRNADLGERMTERFGVAGALLVKTYGDDAEESSQFRARVAAVRDVGVRTALSSRVFFAGLTALAALATAMVYGVGGWLAISGAVTTGSLVALAALLGRLYGPITGLANVQIDVMTALVSFERVFEVLDLRPAVRDPEHPVPLPEGPLDVELDDVVFTYPVTPSLVSLGAAESPKDGDDDGEQADTPDQPDRPVLRGVSLHAGAGEVVALVGRSGAGKTTLASLVARLYDVDSGAVRVGGVDVRDVTQAELRRRVGVVSQDAHLFHDTVRANLRYGSPGAGEEELWTALAAARADAVVRALPQGLDTVVGERGHRLSGGEKQRVALARLLLRAPSVVILDEATAHLDSESERAVQEALDAALVGRTSIVIAHRLSTVRSADLICVVDDGQVVERGTHAELIARAGLYADLYRTQFADGADGTDDADGRDGVVPASTPHNCSLGPGTCRLSPVVSPGRPS
ncbi:ATP-binding cassette, subfamily B [Quadrisphaera granulorum]|uniref:ATP-binding cassette subfamily B protein n=1 Tax=Quadrisphaera granulorum TaxID=317664 RepID=A0A315ZYV2_9ACTN|nr:ABC transporter ATP-binding protein [Quadrisphaera granulorum]PWJ50675.1 ATP-binding cassette subfamily B protein [Quadrisphaera granulorum]SZE97923.1 ATP-binding cassette, subfamily B [Quadrisphaera granulorum]